MLNGACRPKIEFVIYVARRVVAIGRTPCPPSKGPTKRQAECMRYYSKEDLLLGEPLHLLFSSFLEHSLSLTLLTLPYFHSFLFNILLSFAEAIQHLFGLVRRAPRSD